MHNTTYLHTHELTHCSLWVHGNNDRKYISGTSIVSPHTSSLPEAGVGDGKRGRRVEWGDVEDPPAASQRIAQMKERRVGGVGDSRICLAQDRKILNPAAFCRLPEILELCKLEVTSCWLVVSFLVSRLGIKLGLHKVKLVPNQYTRWKTDS